MSENHIPLSARSSLNCAQTEALLSDYIDHELVPDMSKKVTTHLEECPACAEILEEMLGLVTIAAELRHVAPPEGVRTRLRKALKERVGFELINS